MLRGLKKVLAEDSLKDSEEESEEEEEEKVISDEETIERYVLHQVPCSSSILFSYI